MLLFHLQGSRARALYKAGLRSPLAIAEASIPEIVKALFESASWASDGNIVIVLSEVFVLVEDGFILLTFTSWKY